MIVEALILSAGLIIFGLLFVLGSLLIAKAIDEKQLWPSEINVNAIVHDHEKKN